MVDTAGSAANLANLAGVIQKLFLGSGNTKTSGTSTTTSDPAAVAALQQILTTAQDNSTDTSKVQPLIDSIINQNQIAFAPQLSGSPTAGLYNDTSRTLLAGNAAAQSSSQVSQAVLNYITGQQQIASNAAGALANATRTTTQNQVSATAPAVNPGVSALAGAGMLAYSAFKNKDSILKFLGFGDTSTDTLAKVATDPVIGNVAGAGSNGFDDITAGFGSTPTPGSINTSLGTITGTGGVDSLTGIGANTDAASGSLDSIFSSVGNFADSSVNDIGNFLSSTASDVGSALGTAGTDVTNFLGDSLSGIGGAISDAASGLGDFVSSLFSGW